MQNCTLARIDILGFVLLSVIVGRVHSADAQDNQLFAGVSLTMSTQGSMRPGGDPDSPTTGVGGSALGVAGDVGTFLTRTLSIAFEVSVPARFESVQETDYYMVSRTANQHRDLVFSGLFHVHVPPAGAVRVAVVGGPSVIREDTLQSTAFALGATYPLSANFGSFGPDRQLTRWTVGLTVGADVGVQVSRRVQILPQIRLHWIERASFGDYGASGSLGLSSLVVRPAIGVRLSF